MNVFTYDSEQEKAVRLTRAALEAIGLKGKMEIKWFGENLLRCRPFLSTPDVYYGQCGNEQMWEVLISRWVDRSGFRVHHWHDGDGFRILGERALFRDALLLMCCDVARHVLANALAMRPTDHPELWEVDPFHPLDD